MINSIIRLLNSRLFLNHLDNLVMGPMFHQHQLRIDCALFLKPSIRHHDTDNIHTMAAS